MRLAVVGLLHETNTFSPHPTGPDDFPLMPVGADQSSPGRPKSVNTSQRGSSRSRRSPSMRDEISGK